jgi:putative NIF3 family GTP cyclohydrolase 1 type 2
MKMDMNTLIQSLDLEFGIEHCTENLVKWAVLDENKSIIYEDFNQKKTALMLKGSDEISQIATVVFVTDTIIAKLKNTKNCLIFTHHNFNYYENEKGLQAINISQLKELLQNQNSLYVAHAPLDTHLQYGTSITLAKWLDIDIESKFYDYFGAPTGVFGHIKRTRIDDFTNRVQRVIQRPYVTIEKYGSPTESMGENSQL